MASRRADLDHALLDGFFPMVGSTDLPARRRAAGLQELGLPYAADAAVTRHLARFLARQTAGGPQAKTEPTGQRRLSLGQL